MRIKFTLHFYTALLLITGTGIRSHAQNFTDLPAFKKANSWRTFECLNYDAELSTILTYIADFNVSPPVFHDIPWSDFRPFAHATAADPVTGELLFYTDSKTIRNRDFEIMPNGADLSGDGFAQQGSCIVAKINDPGKYYVFAIPAYDDPISLRYSLVDMSLDGGKGDVVPTQKNILLEESPLGEMMIAVPGSQCDVWLLVHPYSEPVFKAYHITEEGIDPDPVLSYTDSTLYGFGAYVSGTMAVSPDRSKIAVSSNGKYFCDFLGYYSSNAGGALLAEFDPLTGTVFNDIKLNDSIAYGVAFSPDGNLLYIGDQSTIGVGYEMPDTGRIYQYDVSDYPASVTLLNVDLLSAPYHGYVHQLRMLPNGHLLGTTFLHYNAPNEIGASAGIDPDYYSWWPSALTYTDSVVVAGVSCLGNDLVFALPPDTTQRTTDTFFCKGAVLHIDMAAAGTAYTWNDGNTDSARSIALPGKYWVSYLTDRCNVTVDTFNIAEYDPDPDLGEDIVVCGDPHTLVPAVSQDGLTYLWSDGSSNSSLAIGQSGTYWVQTSIESCTGSDTILVTAFPNVGNMLGDDIAICKGDPISLTLSAPLYEGAGYLWNTGDATNTIAVTDAGTYTVSLIMPPCSGADSIRIYREVCACYFDVPTVFSPNGDGLNDYFNMVLEPGCPVYGYTLYIYNRYGQRIYEGFRADQGWDGTHGGQAADAGAYMYELRFFGGTRQVLYTRKGDITLIR